MPLRNGTGPFGSGPGTGRKRGGCRTGFSNRGGMFRSVVRGRHGWLTGIAIPFVTVVVRDLLNPSGVLRRIVRVFATPKITDQTRNTTAEAEYSVIDELPSSAVRKNDRTGLKQ